MSKAWHGRVVATSYTMAGAQEVTAELARQGISARVSDEGMATYIYTGPNMEAAVNFIRVPEDAVDRALEILSESEDLEFMLVDPEDFREAEAEVAAKDEEPEDLETARARGEDYARRSLRATGIAVLIMLVGPVALWLALKALSAPIEGKPRRQARWALGISILPTAVTVLVFLQPFFYLLAKFMDRRW